MMNFSKQGSSLCPRTSCQRISLPADYHYSFCYHHCFHGHIGSSSYVNAQLTRDIVLLFFTCLLKLLWCHYAFMMLIYVENYSSMLCVSFLFVFWKLLTFINLLILKNEPSIHACMIYQYATHHYPITVAMGSYCCFEKSMLLLQCSWAN
jgi:hypothetical protein